MFELILIFAVALLVLPLIDLVCQAPITEPYARRARFLKIVVIVLALIWLVLLLFYPGTPMLPHVTWGAR